MSKDTLFKALKDLQLDQNCTVEEINKAYRKRAKETHPDRNNNKEEEFLRIKTSRDFLLELRSNQPDGKLEYGMIQNEKKSTDEKVTLKVFLKEPIVFFTLLLLLQLAVFLKIGLNTLLKVSTLLWIFLPFIVASVVIYNLVKRSKMMIFSIVFLLPSLLIVLNRLNGKNDRKEEYFYSCFGPYKEIQSTNLHYASTLIHLKGDVYAEYHGIRLFNDLDPLLQHNKIRYHFRKGLLGWEYISDYELIK